MSRHLDRCESCRTEVAVLTDFVAAARADRFNPVRRWLAVAAAALVTILSAPVVWYLTRPPVAPLIAATEPLGFRIVELRLSGGFGWARYRGAVRSSTESRDPDILDLRGAAGKVLRKAEAKPTPERKHAAAVAELLLEDPAAAIAILKEVTAERPDDAHAWSDLAAAHFAAATHFDKPAEYSDALAAADRAIRIDPKLPEAHFNRALIVQRKGVKPEARDAWTKYLELDSTSEWATEARSHLEAVSGPTDQLQFDRQKPQLERDAAAGNIAAVRAVVDRFPQLSRELVERDVLARWGDAYRAGNAAEAERALAIARSIGDALRARGEELSAAMVAAIDAAPPATRLRLAAASAPYRDGRNAALTSRPHDARNNMLEAAELFGETPGALSARHFAAVALEQANDLENAERELAEVLSRTPAGYKAQRAQLEWDLGLLHAKRARWPDALKHYQSSAALFAELGERDNHAWVQWLVGEAWSFLGRRDDAWKEWANALPAVTEHTVRRFSASLNGMSRAELTAGHADAARSLAEIALRPRIPETVRAEVLLRLAVLSARSGDHAAAVAALTEGQHTVARLTDKTMRAQTNADFEFAEGVTYTTTDPRRALEALNRAAAIHTKLRPMCLPATQYERARILRTMGRSDEAQSALESAVAAIESQRKPVEWRATSSGALDGVDEIYTTLAELLLERGQTREAFVITDRAAAFAFYGADATGSVTTLAALQQQLAPGSIVVEYLVRPQKTFIFVAGAQSFDVRTIDVAAAEVERVAAVLDGTLRRRAAIPEVVRASKAMETILLAPVRDLLARADIVTFVPDPLIASVPLPALIDPASGRWLVEQHSIRVAASALFRSAAATPLLSEKVLVIHPSAGGVSLPQTKAEVATLQHLFPQATLLQGNAITVASVLSAMRDAGVIHYTGHAGGEGDAGLVLSDGELLYGSDVTRERLRGTPLVVLAGCRTLRGGARREDLATSLARAFLLAGARSVVGTTWDVDDPAAATFFSRFHELNSASGNPVTALSEAQRSMLHGERRHPAEWAFAQIVVRTIDT